MVTKIDARTDEEKERGDGESVILGLTILPNDEGVLQMTGVNIPGADPKIILELTANEDGSMRFGLLAGYPFNEVDGLDGLVEVMETYVELLKNPAVRHAFVEERVQPTPEHPTLFGEDEHAPEPGA